MIGERIKFLRNAKGMTLDELAKKVNKSVATISRTENNLSSTWDPEYIEKLAEALETSPAYLLGLTEDYRHRINDSKEENYIEILVSNSDLVPIIPSGAMVRTRQFGTNEDIQVDGIYYIEFEGEKRFRMAIENSRNEIGFMPISPDEKRIAFNIDEVEVLGKAISMEVYL